MSDDVREKLSALVDGELSDAEAVHLLDRMSHDNALKDVWERYHLVSDVLRNHLSPVTSVDLVARVRHAIDDEPIILRPPKRTRDPVWKPVAGFALAASVAVVAVLGFRGFSGFDGEPVVETVAQRDPAPVVKSVGLRWNVDRPDVEERLNAYLVNHSEHTGSAMRGMMPYARIVVYDAGR